MWCKVYHLKNFPLYHIFRFNWIICFHIVSDSESQVQQQIYNTNHIGYAPTSSTRIVKKRNTANKKERRRTQSINNAFSYLREKIPNVPTDTKLSKVISPTEIGQLEVFNVSNLNIFLIFKKWSIKFKKVDKSWNLIRNA